MRTRAKSNRPAIIYSVALDGKPNLDLMPTEREVWLSKTCKCRMYTFRRVPAKRITVLVEQTEHSGWVWVVRICQKEGRYDGTERPELVIRQMQPSQVKDWPIGRIEEVDDTIRIYPTLEQHKSVTPSWVFQLERIGSTEGHDPFRCYMWQWARYYRLVVTRDVAEQAALAFQDAFSNESDLNALNRYASRDLYALSRAAGYRKLTLDEQRKYGVTGQWHHQDTLLKGLARERLLESVEPRQENQEPS